MFVSLHTPPGGQTQLPRLREQGGVSQPQELPAPPEGEIPRRSDPTQSYDCNESRSLYSSEHLNSRAPEASAAHCFLQIRHKTQKPAKMSAACGPRCQIKLSVDWKVADETFPKEKKELSGCLFVLRPVRPSVHDSSGSSASCPDLGSAADPQRGFKVTKERVT